MNPQAGSVMNYQAGTVMNPQAGSVINHQAGSVMNHQAGTVHHPAMNLQKHIWPLTPCLPVPAPLHPSGPRPAAPRFIFKKGIDFIKDQVIMALFHVNLKPVTILCQ